MSIQDEFPPESHWITDHQLTDAYTRLRARAVEMEKALAKCEKHLDRAYSHTVAGEECDPIEESGWILLCEVRATLPPAP